VSALSSRPMPVGITSPAIGSCIVFQPPRSPCFILPGRPQPGPPTQALLNWISRDLDRSSPWNGSAPSRRPRPEARHAPRTCLERTYLFEAAAYHRVRNQRWRAKEANHRPCGQAGRQPVRPPSSRWADRRTKPRGLLSIYPQGKRIMAHAGNTHSCRIG